MTEHFLKITKDDEGNLCFIDEYTGECIIKVPAKGVSHFMSKLLSVVY